MSDKRRRDFQIQQYSSGGCLGACIYLSPSDLEALGIEPDAETVSYKIDPEGEELLLRTSDNPE